MPVSAGKKVVQVTMDNETIEHAKDIASCFGLSFSSFVGLCVNSFVKSDLLALAFRQTAYELGISTDVIDHTCEVTGLQDPPHTPIDL